MSNPITLVCLLAFLLSTATGAEPTVDAADVYRQAFAQLESTVASEAVALDDLDEAPLDNDRVAELLKARAPVLALLRQAAALPAADWGELGGDLKPVMKSLGTARRAAALARLQARLDLREGRPAEAVENLLAAVALARNVGRQKVLVVRMVEIGTEWAALDQLAAMLPRLPKDVVAALPQKLAALPEPVSGKDTILAELAFGRQAVRKQGGAATFLALKPFYTKIADAMDQAPADFAKVVDAEAARFKANPHARILAPTFKRLREPMAALEAKRAMLPVAVDVVLKGPDAVKASRDPFGTGAPFAYEAAGGAFTLTSALVVRGRPVTLSTGAAAGGSQQ